MEKYQIVKQGLKCLTFNQDQEDSLDHLVEYHRLVALGMLVVEPPVEPPVVVEMEYHRLVAVDTLVVAPVEPTVVPPVVPDGSCRIVDTEGEVIDLFD
jgi:hypothetical protein